MNEFVRVAVPCLMLAGVVCLFAAELYASSRPGVRGGTPADPLSTRPAASEPSAPAGHTIPGRDAPNGCAVARPAVGGHLLSQPGNRDHPPRSVPHAGLRSIST